MDLRATYRDRRIHEGWASVYRSNPLQERLNEAIMDRILGALDPAPDALFLDAGCGTGAHTVRIARRGFRCIGVDISEAALGAADRAIAEHGLRPRAAVACQKLEALSFADATFDVAHCRGVLMHIPDWERAVGHLCRVLKPGGRLVVLESNRRALETLLVRLARRAGKGRKSRLVVTRGGLEFWAERDGSPFVARVTDLGRLAEVLESHGFRVVARFATEFWDINRFPKGAIRDGVIRFNRLWFAGRLPAFLSAGNAVIAEKRPS